MSCPCYKWGYPPTMDIPDEETSMICPCNKWVHPPTMDIPAGLSWIPRQIAGFQEFRKAMLAATRMQPSMESWRARESNDFGVMLLEMGAYVFDVLAFYDQTIANECYLRSARLRPSIRKLVGLIGYRPRPAVGAQVTLAAFAEERKPVTLPTGTAFRSGAFDGQAPQVFELERDAAVHPAFNRWAIKPMRPMNFGRVIRIGTNVTRFQAGLSAANLIEKMEGTPPPSFVLPFPGLHRYASQKFLLLKPETSRITEDDLLLVYERSDDNRDVSHQAVKAVEVSRMMSKDGCQYVKADLDHAVRFPVGTPMERIRISKPMQKAYLRKDPVTGVDGSDNIAVTLDRLYPLIRPGSYVIMTWGDGQEVYSVRKIEETSEQMIQDNLTIITPEIPPARISVSKITVAGKQLPSVDYETIIVHFDFGECGRITAEAGTTITGNKRMEILDAGDQPADISAPAQFLFEDKNLKGVLAEGSVNLSSGILETAPGTSWIPVLSLPIAVYGNVVTATRGETVEREVLGSGDASIPNQTFKLGKRPMTYLPKPTAENETGVASALEVYADGIRWTEVPSFFGASGDSQVYIVRQDDESNSYVTFGDGRRGARLPTGRDNVIVNYRYGAGAAAPPAGSITQIARPVKGLKSVKQPVPAGGGDDAESGDHMQQYAPNSALLLGRAVSILDMETLAAQFPGVRAAAARWGWDGTQQRPVVEVWYIGDTILSKGINERLHALTDPATPISVRQATSLPANLELKLVIDPRYLQEDVETDVRQILMQVKTGLLTPEKLGIGRPLYRSHIFDAVLDVPGALAVHSIKLNGEYFSTYAFTPGAGNYFDFEKGSLNVF